MEAVYYHLGTVKVAARVIYESFRDMPPIHTWHMWPAHLQERVDSHQFPPMADLVVPALGYFMLLNVARYALQYFIFRPLAIFARDIKEVKHSPNKTLDAFMANKKKITLHNIGNISKVTGASEGAIKEYVQTKKKNNSNEQKITKFIEALWRTIFYGWFTIVGVKTMLYPDVIPWVTDNRELYLGWPEAHIASAAVMYYYQIELGSYFHQLLWTEVSRSDSIEMIAHHIITILLLTVSHSCSFHRYGTMLLILHDVSDVFLESAKCFNYIAQVPSRKHFQSVCDGLFVGFVVSFFVCRLILYPKVFLINSFAYAIPEYFKPYFYFAVIILTLFSLLFFLHCFWFYLTIKMAIRILFPGEDGVSDVRSDNEDEVDDFAEDLNKSKDPPIARKKTKKDN